VRTLTRLSVPVVVSNHALSCIITSPAPDVYRPWGSSVVVQAVATADPGSITQMVLRIEGRDYASTNANPAEFVWATTNFGAGNYPVQVLAQATDGRSVISTPCVIRLYTDTDGDGLPDQWEYQHFGSTTSCNPTNDTDSDGWNNWNEYLAGTQPTNSEHKLDWYEWNSTENNALNALLGTSTNRLYTIEALDHDLIADPWTNRATFRGTNWYTSWSDTGDATHRFYRVRAHISD
jgi:hypothetical protein